MTTTITPSRASHTRSMVGEQAVFFYIPPKKSMSPIDIIQKYNLDRSFVGSKQDITTEIDTIAYNL